MKSALAICARGAVNLSVATLARAGCREFSHLKILSLSFRDKYSSVDHGTNSRWRALDSANEHLDSVSMFVRRFVCV